MTISSEKLENTNNIFHLNIPHIHFHNHNNDHEIGNKDIPKGCLAVMVGEEEEQRERRGFR
ncbi:hypothetical protein F8388_019605 [Cannabis sativa]|uniref:Uncharacterized protein n=1 Tax=Cannabis sativa TaxID=3483 RepID=A0A7J6DZP9_CANSA|nr:hypothetical protein F8388_019605 [Cannabis sativa]KAF4351551.1 hypothetical protein G4B88_000589 [Cannabis sativa]